MTDVFSRRRVARRRLAVRLLLGYLVAALGLAAYFGWPGLWTSGALLFVTVGMLVTALVVVSLIDDVVS